MWNFSPILTEGRLWNKDNSYLSYPYEQERTQNIRDRMLNTFNIEIAFYLKVFIVGHSDCCGSLVREGDIFGLTAG